jgi:hypothetical protein
MTIAGWPAKHRQTTTVRKRLRHFRVGHRHWLVTRDYAESGKRFVDRGKVAVAFK